MRDNRGQSLVETALTLPLLVFFVFGVVWLICFAHNTVVLETMALDKARMVSANPGAIAGLLPLGKLWGSGTPPIARRSTQSVPGWRPFIPSIVPIPLLPSVQKAPGSFIRVTCTTYVIGRGMWLPYLPLRELQTAAETLVEAPQPPDA